MRKLTRVLTSLLALLAVCAPIAYAHDESSGPASGKAPEPPKVSDTAAISITDTGATLRANIEPKGDDSSAVQTAYHFEFGTSTAFASSTANGYLQSGQKKTTVTAPVEGLTPGTIYVYRAVASNAAGTTYGERKTFKTKGKAHPTPNGPKSPKSDEPAPALGHSVVAEAASGVVMVRKHGSDEFVPLDDAAKVPVDSTFDATNGTVLIEAARGGGESNTGAFHGGVFKVHQSHEGKGMTRIALRGGDFSSCPNGASARALRSRHGGGVRKLWGKDHGGRFKTSGRGSVATVRGTVWYTEDRCDGTLTKVKKGAVMVRERGTGRHKLLHRGQGFFAHLPN
jgi:hypothetical protein